jgi:aldehyde dehydrogenase (NAD+)
VKLFKLFINNEWVDAEQGKTFESSNPCNGDVIAAISSASEADVNKAIAAAKDAFQSGAWPGLDYEERAVYMHRAADILEKRIEEFARWEALDSGKTIKDARNTDIPLAIKAFRYHADAIKAIKGKVIPIPGHTQFDYVTYEPYGVVACIAPWNYPIHLLTRSICPALAAGNTIVAKPSSFTSITAQLLSEVFLEAGFPKGVYNAIPGPGSVVGEALLAHDDVALVALTGSEEVGRRLMTASAQARMIKKLILELGGKSASIVEPDCDMEGAVNGVILGFCANQGEICCGATRLLLSDEIYDPFMEKLIRKLSTVRVGDSLDEHSQMGALVNKRHRDSVHRFVAQAVEQGGKIRCGGTPLTGGIYDQGAFYPPTVIDNVTEKMTIFHEEVFGPVLAVTKYHTTDEAIRLANATRFGLAACVFSENPRKLYQVARRLDAGTVWMNTASLSNIEAPFGGNRNSGIGRENSEEGLLEYLKVKNNIQYVGTPYVDILAD